MRSVVRVRATLALLAVALLAAATGCHGARARSTADALLEARASAHVYRRPAAEVSAAVRAQLAEDGFTLVPTDTGAFVHTQWKSIIDDDEFASTRVRYVVLVKRLTEHHSRVEAVQITLSTIGMETYHPLKPSSRSPMGSHQSSGSSGRGLAPLASMPRTYARDLAFEWRVLRRVDPEGARRLQASSAPAGGRASSTLAAGERTPPRPAAP